MELLAAGNPTTGSETLDALIAFLAIVFGVGGTWRGGKWIKSGWDMVQEVRRIRQQPIDNALEIEALKKEVAELRARQAKHEQDDEINAMVAMGFIEVGEEAVIVVKEDGKTIKISPALTKLMGLSTEEAINGAWKDIIHPADRVEVLGKWAAFVNGSLLHLEMRFRFQSPSGRIEPVVMNVVRKKLGDGVAVRLVGIVHRQGEEPSPVPDTRTA